MTSIRLGATMLATAEICAGVPTCKLPQSAALTSAKYGAGESRTFAQEAPEPLSAKTAKQFCR